MYHSFIIQLAGDGHVGWIHFLAIVKTAAMHMVVSVWWAIWYLSRNDMTGFQFLRNPNTYFVKAQKLSSLYSFFMIFFVFLTYWCSFSLLKKFNSALTYALYMTFYYYLFQHILIFPCSFLYWSIVFLVVYLISTYLQSFQIFLGVGF